MYNSVFSYNITRSYPYTWFTWVVVIGGLLATALFSVVNLVANGYEPAVRYSWDLNGTEHPRTPAWYGKAPWAWAQKVASTCEAQTIALASSIYTRNLGASYTILSLNNATDDRPMINFAYRNDPLNCTISEMDLEIQPKTVKALSSGAQVNLEGVSSQINVQANCVVHDENSSPINMILGLNQPLEYFALGGVQNEVAFVSADNETQSSLLLGLEMMRLFETALEYVPVDQTYGSSLQAYWNFTYNAEPGVTRMSSFIYWPDNTASLLCNSSLPVNTWSTTFGTDMVSEHLLCNASGYTDLTPYTNVSDAQVIRTILYDGFAKSLYALILADLGQSQVTPLLSSPLQTMDAINASVAFVTSSIQPHIPYEAVVSQLGNSSMVLLMPPYHYPGPYEPEVFFRWLNVRPPQVNQTGIATQYLCQSPRLKSLSSVIVSVAVADLVFLHALWVVFNFLVSYLLQRDHPDANYCRGCSDVLFNTKVDDDIHEASSTDGYGTRRTSNKIDSRNDYNLLPIPPTVIASSRADTRQIEGNGASQPLPRRPQDRDEGI